MAIWPLAARVPITIELKNYAFWYGTKADTESRLLLTYLSSTFTNEIGEPVSAGTLRAMFSESRWLFIFDGLDEVPSGVKSGLAQEITNFVDNVLLSQSSDAVVICTSRPQGYAGQFNDLNAAEINLLPLTTVQALECAKPLLKYERPKAENERYIKILSTALLASAVAEIMTTPLQSHIMAVIVRDGGPPPDRKWALYNSFYNVIKKREANKGFPDERTNRLLREGDVLLRRLHDRLGFELHRLAETTAGASTSMPREELLKIVTEVVTELLETDIESTVATLMDATTERLVLVNTPETKDSVRFDIRPLQEFFAAEYIHKSGVGAVFPERVRLIAGDSHWREVMHFLVSALVEEGRKSELAQTVSELIALDIGQEGDRTLQRRLSRGGLITGRLLSEGVLERV